MLPQLRKLEEQFRETLVVIGVHSPKFPGEAVTANLRQAVMRCDIRHPVVNDHRHAVWDSYAVSAWPTTVLIVPGGRVVATHAGEFLAEDFARVISMLAEEFDRQAQLDHTPLYFPKERDQEPDRLLAYPGKVLADVPAGRLFIADTGHHRVLVADLQGRVQTIVGRGEPGLEDGDFESAAFHAPQGLAADGSALYVADTGNHAIRRVDLAARRVTRIAGTGEALRLPRRGGPALETALTSPWDLAVRAGELLIAMAGNHQVWRLDLAAGEVRRLAGTGREDLGDGTLERCALAQPSGLALAGDRLYFADSESSAVRVADLARDRVETLVGEGLFEFGDADGQGSDVRLQHCLGVAWQDGALYVADTYNHKIKYLDPAPRACLALLGSGEPGLSDGPGPTAQFWEPGGISAADGRLYVADTNNHAIRVANMATGEVATLMR